MKTNFDFLLADPRFADFADVAVAAEKILHIDPAAAVLNCRRAMEFAIKWMYSVDDALDMPYEDSLVSLLNARSFKQLMDEDVWRRMDFIRRMGNNAAHNEQDISQAQALLCLENLHSFLDFLACCYGESCRAADFDARIAAGHRDAAAAANTLELDIQKLMAENRALKAELTARRAGHRQTYVPKPLSLSEYETRKIYIDAMLMDAGWTEGVDWKNEVELGELGLADYVLYDDEGKPLAVIEAQRTGADLSDGCRLARQYADFLENKHKRRPVIFLTNGFEVRIDDGLYPERQIAAIYSKWDLVKLFRLRSRRRSLTDSRISKNMAERYYQREAVNAVCAALEQQRRKALISMAPGAGKTLTAIALCGVLLERNWVRNILFLTDRSALATQAQRSFARLLPHLSAANLCQTQQVGRTHCVFATCEAMMESIDSVTDERGSRLFTCGHFDLVICDEAHSSIYSRYRDIFNYFDAPLLGLTATPPGDSDRLTYEIFEPEQQRPTYSYELAQAVQDGYLVDFHVVETMPAAVCSSPGYDELSPEERAACEDTFVQNGSAAAPQDRLFRDETIRQALHTLMREGLCVDRGKTFGKTILFAHNSAHARQILEVFNREYPQLKGWAAVIDGNSAKTQRAIDAFAAPDGLPRIAISPDTLDAGIDIPAVLNLVFLRQVISKARFWQMIGRGTRLCPGLMDGADKKQFYIFDFCGNFEFFRMSRGSASRYLTPQGRVFRLRALLLQELENASLPKADRAALRDTLVTDMVRQVKSLKRDSFAVRQHLKFVDLYSNPEHYAALTPQELRTMTEKLAPLMAFLPEEETITEQERERLRTLIRRLPGERTEELLAEI